MTSAPLCPIHGTALSPPKGKGFSWYCPKKSPDGSWCPTKIRAEGSPAPAQNVVPVANTGPSTLSDEAIRLRLCEAMLKGSNPDEALFHAKAFFEWVKEGK